MHMCTITYGPLLFFTGQNLFHFMGTSTFSEYTVIPEISLAKVRGCVWCVVQLPYTAV